MPQGKGTAHVEHNTWGGLQQRGGEEYQAWRRWCSPRRRPLLSACAWPSGPPPPFSARGGGAAAEASMPAPPAAADASSMAPRGGVMASCDICSADSPVAASGATACAKGASPGSVPSRSAPRGSCKKAERPRIPGAARGAAAAVSALLLDAELVASSELASEADDRDRDADMRSAGVAEAAAAGGAAAAAALRLLLVLLPLWTLLSSSSSSEFDASGVVPTDSGRGASVAAAAAELDGTKPSIAVEEGDITSPPRAAGVMTTMPPLRPCPSHSWRAASALSGTTSAGSACCTAACTCTCCCNSCCCCRLSLRVRAEGGVEADEVGTPPSPALLGPTGVEAAAGGAGTKPL